MDPNAQPVAPITPATAASATPPAPPSILVCSYCHQPILSSYYYCPNCGTKISSAALSTSPQTQAWLYIFSIILPMILFIFVTKWQGMKYYRSSDPKAKQIGMNAIVLITLSTLITIWLSYVWTQDFIRATQASLNADLSADLGS